MTNFRVILIVLVALAAMTDFAGGQTSAPTQPHVAGVPANAAVTVTVAQPLAAGADPAQAGSSAATQPATISITFGPGPVTQAGMSQLFGEVMQCLSQVNAAPAPGQSGSGSQQLYQQQLQRDQWKEYLWRQQLQQDFWKQQLWQQQLLQDQWKRLLWRQQLRQDWWKQQLRKQQ